MLKFTLGVLAIVFALSAPARAACPPAEETTTCPGGTVGRLITYKQVSNPSVDDTRAGITDCGTEVRLRGYWFKPTTPKPAKGFPTIIYNHGSEETPGNKCAIVEPLVKQGFAVFVPHRRGHGKSTGIYYEVWSLFDSLLDCANDPVNCRVYKRESTMAYLHRQANDVADAYAKIAGFDSVNPKKMSLMGHSFGGMVTLFTNERDLGQQAAVAIAPGGESWDGDPCVRVTDFPRCLLYLRGGVLQEYLLTAIDEAKQPVFFFDTKNDVSIAPVYELAYYGWKTYADRFQAAIYTPVANVECAFPNADGVTVVCGRDEPERLCPPDPATGEQDTCGTRAHSAFVTDPAQIDKWIPTVVDFIDRFGGR